MRREMTASEAQLLLFAVCHEYDEGRWATHGEHSGGGGDGVGVATGVCDLGGGEVIGGDGDEEDTLVESGANRLHIRGPRGAGATKVCSVS